jgi:tetratricopeptide (TPR) repeat protein
MDSFAKPLRALAEDAAWFVREKRLRLLHVVTSGDLRDSVLDVVMGQEFHADNHSPFLRLEDAYSPESRGWEDRALRVREQHAARREAMAKEGQDLPPLPPPSAEKGDALTAFAVLLRQVADARCAPLEGLVVVLAPTRMEDPREWQRELRVLVEAPKLADVRWVVVELDRSSLGPMVEALGAKALSNTCQVDENALQAELARMLDGAGGASSQAPGPAQAGAAWPRGVVPPPRKGKPTPSPAQVEAALKEAGIAPGIAGESGRQLRQKVLLAAQALRQKKVEAIQLQREARDLCLKAGLIRESVLMELILASYLAHLGQPAKALEQYEAAFVRAQQEQLPQLAAQAQLAIGALHFLARKPELAAAAYLRGAECAKAADVALLAIEGYRLAGQAWADLGKGSLATQAWRSALAVAEKAPQEEVKASSAAETARALAALCRKHGLAAQAQSLEEQSLRLEHGEELPPQEKAVAR